VFTWSEIVASTDAEADGSNWLRIMICITCDVAEKPSVGLPPNYGL